MSREKSHNFFDWTFYKLIYHANNKKIKNYDDCFNHFINYGHQNSFYINDKLNLGDDILKFDYEEYNNRYHLEKNDFVLTKL